MSLGQIIRDKREGLRFTLDEVAAKTGFSKPYLSTVETGRVTNPPSDNLLSKLELVLGFEQGLLQYIAHMERMPVDVRRDFEARDAENKKYRQIIRNLVERKTDVGKLGDILGAEGLEVGAVEETITAGGLIPVINKVSAGYPVDFDDMGYPVGFADDYVRCPGLHDPNTFAVRVVGDSMESKFHAGDIVIFSPAVEVQNGDDCFVRFTRPHETTFKRVFFEEDNRIRLQPRNENYAPTIVEGDRVNGIYRAVIRYESL